MENRYKINYDLKNRLITNIRFKQGDTDSSILDVFLFDGGLVKNITGQTITFKFLKGDKTTVTQDNTTNVSIVDALEGNCQCILKNETLSYPGIVICEIEYRESSGAILSTAKFNFMVEESIGGGPLSTNYISSIENKIIDMQNTFEANEDARDVEFEVIKTDYDTYKNVMIAESNVAELQNNINMNTSSLADNVQQTFNARATKRKAIKPSISFIDDDGHTEVYTKWFPIMVNKGITMTSALITARVDNASYNYMISSSQIKEMQAAGAEFVSHTHNHVYCTELTDEELRVEFEESQAWLKDNNCNYRTLVYSYGSVNSRVRNIVKEYFDLGIYTAGGCTTMPLRSYYLQRQTIDAITLEQGKAFIDECVANNTWLIFETHCFMSAWENGAMTTQIEAIIDYARSLDVEIINTAEGYKRFGNIVEVGEYSGYERDFNIIDVNGNTHGKNLGSSEFVLYSDLNNPSDINGDISLFKDNCTTKIRFTSASTTGLGIPGNVPGILEITRSDTFAYQKYNVFSSDIVYTRYWDGIIWTAWVSLNVTAILISDSVNANTLLTGFPTGVSIVFSRTPNSVGFPANSGGQLITYNNGGNGYSYQDYKPINTTDKYIRYATSGGWSVWERFAKESAIRQPIATGGYTNTSPITDFPLGMTINTVATGSAIGLPENYAGLLTTWRASNDSYSKQEYRIHVSNSIYTRYISTGTTWSAWVKVSAI